MASSVKKLATPDAAAALDFDARIMDMVRIMARVANRDFSEKPTLIEGADPLSFLTVGFRFMVEDLERALQDLEHERSELQRANEMLKSLDAAKTRFINTAAHELGTPLTPILLQLSMLRQHAHGRLTPAQDESVAMLERNMNRLAFMVKDMLDVARLQSRGMRLRIGSCDVGVIGQHVVKSFSQQAERQRVSLSFIGEQGAKVLADENRLMQVLFNLVSNALKFTPAAGSIVVRVRTEDDGVHVEVTDSGIGLSETQIGRLFQPFSQIDQTMVAAAPSGTGLGLFISKGIVELHGGSIASTSKGPGLGSTFSFWVPRAGPVAAPADRDH